MATDDHVGDSVVIEIRPRGRTAHGSDSAARPAAELGDPIAVDDPDAAAGEPVDHLERRVGWIEVGESRRAGPRRAVGASHAPQERPVRAAERDQDGVCAARPGVDRDHDVGDSVAAHVTHDGGGDHAIEHGSADLHAGPVPLDLDLDIVEVRQHFAGGLDLGDREAPADGRFAVGAAHQAVEVVSALGARRGARSVHTDVARLTTHVE